MSAQQRKGISIKTLLVWLVAVLAIAAVIALPVWVKGKNATNPQGSGRGSGSGGGQSTPVGVATARVGNMDVTLNALGTVAARATATVKPRVDGLLLHVLFSEGQAVKAGDVLAEIDPEPFKIQLVQAEGQLARDEALLMNSRLDLERYRGLLAKDSIARQQVDTQEALVRQNEGVVKTDRAAVSNARLQLEYTRITAPLSGRIGLRQVDPGNMVHVSDTTGLAAITQTQPINIVFSIPEQDLSEVAAAIRSSSPLEVAAYDRDNKVLLATGKLLTIDNQIDLATGTVKLKAEFTNEDESLFPNQFVNVRLRVKTLQDVVLAPTAAVQRGTNGAYCYVVSGADSAPKAEPVEGGKVQPEATVDLRLLKVGPSDGNLVTIFEGVHAGEQVVIDGTDRLRQDAKVVLVDAEARARMQESGAKGGSGKGKGGDDGDGKKGGKGDSSEGGGAPARDGGMRS
ncbi:MAG: MdtA/MuxA family multidrug efflux RND transporter periplasmic adaptor subunit [Betaproteobacteria bacterium]|nr:MdtA/MuxA family multidrug efflux RND transporter periplasmic adaptor subunit [Betaproteobacteria bacterium]